MPKTSTCTAQTAIDGEFVANKADAEQFFRDRVTPFIKTVGVDCEFEIDLYTAKDAHDSNSVVLYILRVFLLQPVSQSAQGLEREALLLLVQARRRYTQLHLGKELPAKGWSSGEGC